MGLEEVFVHESNIRRPLVVSACVCVCVLNIRYIFVIGPLVSEKLFFFAKKRHNVFTIH